MIDSVYANYTEAAEKQFQSGEISKLDLLNAKSQHNRLKLKVKQTINDINIANEELNALLQSDTTYTATYQPLKRIDIIIPQLENTPGYQALEQNIQQNNAMVKTEKNKLLPDITLGYFNGTNQYDNADNYYGVHVGLAIPLFFGNQKAQIDAAKQEHLSAVFKQHDYKMRYNLKLNSLQEKLKRHHETLQYYEETGLELSEQITETARKSYDAGEIDFFRFVHSIENAINIKIEYLDNLQKYNSTILEINFLTLN
jgi:cobalt-zinc-cadmium resistance protein CzcA